MAGSTYSGKRLQVWASGTFRYLGIPEVGMMHVARFRTRHCDATCHTLVCEVGHGAMHKGT